MSINQQPLIIPKGHPLNQKILANDGFISHVFAENPEEPSSQAEAHEDYTDIFIILEGEEELFIGGEIKNSQEVSPGEFRGFPIVNATRYKVVKGDTVIIPHSVPHYHGKGRIKLAVIKVKKN